MQQIRFILSVVFFVITLFSLFPRNAFAVENPFSVPNNKVGIHILFPEELDEAAALVNSNNGDWGYVTIPIQAGDKDMVKWQTFMDEARQKHIIPIVRLATEGDYFNTKVWRKPTAADVLDFANFLSSLDWPTKNRYIIVFNEVNRADEWGGKVNPAEYADLLTYASIVFKARSDDFFIISAGLDNAAPNSGTEYRNEYTFLEDMHQALPDVFDKIDGIASHSYPNPGFSQPPTNNNKTSIASFRFESNFVKNINGKTLPVFITETGWSSNRVADDLMASYYTLAFGSVWNTAQVVAVTPFLLQAGNGPFEQFSFITNGNKSLAFHALSNLPKSKGAPTLSENKKTASQSAKILGLESLKSFNASKDTAQASITIPPKVKTILKWLLEL